MKSSKDPRHQKRIEIVKQLFAWQFNPKTKLDKPASEVTQKIDKIDQLIKTSAPSRPLEQINKIDLAILRLAVFELIIKPDAPYKVVVDEGVELAKEFGSESSPAFINGALGNLIEVKKLEKEDNNA